MPVHRILYKYVDAEGLKRLWESEKIRFTQLNQLNDPYENRIFDPNVDMKVHELKELSNNNQELFKLLFHVKKTQSKQYLEEIQNEIDNRFGVFSLTRNPMNLLMWAHYADEHKGAVVGLDVSNPIFRDIGIIRNPDEGNVVYSSIKPKIFKQIDTEFQPKEDGKGYSVISSLKDSCHIDFAFLYKGIDWAYEEEVRIVRDFFVEKGEVKRIKDKEIVLFPLPKSAIKTVIFGDRYTDDITKNSMLTSEMDIEFFKASIDDYEYKIRITPLNKALETEKKILPRLPLKGQMIKGNNNRKQRKK